MPSVNRLIVVSPQLPATPMIFIQSDVASCRDCAALGYRGNRARKFRPVCKLTSKISAPYRDPLPISSTLLSVRHVGKSSCGNVKYLRADEKPLREMRRFPCGASTCNFIRSSSRSVSLPKGTCEFKNGAIFAIRCVRFDETNKRSERNGGRTSVPSFWNGNYSGQFDEWIMQDEHPSTETVIRCQRGTRPIEKLAKRLITARAWTRRTAATASDYLETIENDRWNAKLSAVVLNKNNLASSSLHQEEAMT